jgi:hypothetical protein
VEENPHMRVYGLMLLPDTDVLPEQKAIDLSLPLTVSAGGSRLAIQAPSRSTEQRHNSTRDVAQTAGLYHPNLSRSDYF